MANRYLPRGTFNINATLKVSGNNFWIGGSGFNTVVTLSCKKPCASNPSAMLVSKVNGVTLEQFKIASPDGCDRIRVVGGSGIKLIKIDGVYGMDSTTNTQAPGGTGVHIDGLRKGEVVHVIHIDSNLIVSDSDQVC